MSHGSRSKPVTTPPVVGFAGATTATATATATAAAAATTSRCARSSQKEPPASHRFWTITRLAAPASRRRHRAAAFYTHSVLPRAESTTAAFASSITSITSDTRSADSVRYTSTATMPSPAAAISSACQPATSWSRPTRSVTGSECQRKQPNC